MCKTCTWAAPRIRPACSKVTSSSNSTGNPVLDRQDFIQAIANKGIGQSVILTLLRHGQRQNASVTLGPPVDKYQPKYPPEPLEIQSWRPGRFYRYNPTSEKWDRVTPSDNEDNLPDEIHQFSYHSGGDPIIMTLTGDPQDEQTSIEVRQGQTHYQTTVAEIATLPEGIRDYAQRALLQAQRKKQRELRLKDLTERAKEMRDQLWQDPTPENWDELTSKMMDNLKVYTQQLDEAAGKPRLMLEGQRQQLQELEKQLQEALAPD